MNLERLRESLEDDSPVSEELLKHHLRTLEATVVLPREDVEEIARNKANVIARIKSLKRFHILLMRGFDPFRGPTEQQARELLVAAGMPQDLVKFGLHPKPVERRVGEKVVHQWCAFLKLDVGLAEEFKPIVKVPIADVNYGFLYKPHAIRVGLNEKLSDFVAKRHELRVGPCTLRLEHLVVADGDLKSDWSIQLPSDGTERRVLLRGVSANVDRSGVKWFQPVGRFQVDVGKLDIEIPKKLDRKIQYDPISGILTVHKAPASSDIEAIRALLVAASRERLAADVQQFVRGKARLAAGRYQIGKGLSLSIPLSCDERAEFSSTTGLLQINGAMSPAGESDLRLALLDAIDMQFRDAISRMIDSAPRLDLNAFVPVSRDVVKLPDGDVSFEGFHNRHVARTHHGLHARAMQELGKQLQKQPDVIRRWATVVAESNLAIVGEADCVVRVANARFRIGPIRVLEGGKVALSRAEVRLVRSNRDILRNYLGDVLPLWDKRDAESSLSIRSIDLALFESRLHVEAMWRSDLFSEPVRINVDVPLKRGGKLDGDAILRSALAGRRMQFGSQLSLTLNDELVDKTDWPASLAVSGKLLRVSLHRIDDGWSCDLHGDDIVDLIPTELGRSVREVLGNASLSIDGAELSSPQDGQSAAIHTKLSWEADGRSLTVPVSIDRSGIHVRDWQQVVKELVLNTLASEHRWPIKITRVQSIDNRVHFDAAFNIGDARVATLLGGTVREGRVTGGTLQVESSAVESWLGEHAGNSILQISTMRFLDGQGLVCDAEARLEPFGTFEFHAIPVAGGKDRFKSLAEACLSQLANKLKPSKTATVGPLTLVLKPSNSKGQFHLLATLLDPKLTLEWKTVTISAAQGVRLGDGQIVDPDAGELRAELAKSFKRVLHVNSQTISVDSIDVTGTSFQDAGIVFDVSATIDNKRLAIKGNRLTARGLTPGKFPDVTNLVKDVVDGAINQFETWSEGKEIKLGTIATLKVTDVDRAARTAEAALRVFGRDAGSLHADFTTPDSPKLKLVNPEKLLQHIVSVTPLAGIAHAGSDSFRISSARIANGGLSFAIDFRPPIIEEFVSTGSVVLNPSEVRFEASKDWSAALWKTVAKKLEGLKWKEPGLPVALQVEKVAALSDGVMLDIKCSVDGLGEFSLNGMRVDQDGLDLDEEVLLVNLATLVSNKLQDVLPDAACTVKSAKVEGSNVVVTLLLAVDGIEPFEIPITIGNDGSLKGFDEKLLLKPFLDKLAREVKGQTLSLPGDCKITVNRAVAAGDLSGVVIDGTISAFEAVTVKVSNVIFTGRNFRTKNMKVERAEIAGLSEALGLGALGDAGVSITDIGPRFDGGTFTGINLTARFVVAELLEAEVSAGIGKGGVKVELPITLVADGLRIPVPPCFALSRWKAQIAETHLGVGCSLGLTVPESEKLIRVDGLLKFPLKRPWQVSAEGDLVLLGFLKPGHSEVVLDFEEKEFRALMTLDLIRVLTFDGRFLARMDPKDFLIEGSGELLFLGTKLAGGYIRIDSVVFVGRAELAVLGVKASASLDGKWAKPLDTWVAAEVGFDLPLVGRIVGSDVKGNPTRGAEFAATILAQRIRLLAIDFEGITKERILDVLFQDRIIPAGLKLLATEGGGGSTVVTPDGSLVRIDPQSGDFTAVSEQDGAFVLRRGNVQPGGGSTEEIVMPHRNQIAQVERDAEGREIKPPVLRPYRRDNEVSKEPWTPPEIIRRYD